MTTKIYNFLFPILFLIFRVHATDTSDNLSQVLSFLENVAKHHRKEPHQPIPIIAIGGCPGVGKTYVSKTLLECLHNKGIRCLILPLDDFNLSAYERNQFETEWSINHFKVELLHMILADINSNQHRIIKKPTYNQITGEVGSEDLDLQAYDLILFEGLYALCTRPPLNFFDYCNFGIFLKADEADIITWKWQREQTKTTPRTPTRFSTHMEAMLAEYHNNIAYSKKNAKFLITKDGQHHYIIEIQQPDAEEICQLNTRLQLRGIE